MLGIASCSVWLDFQCPDLRHGCHAVSLRAPIDSLQLFLAWLDVSATLASSPPLNSEERLWRFLLGFLHCFTLLKTRLNKTTLRKLILVDCAVSKILLGAATERAEIFWACPISTLFSKVEAVAYCSTFYVDEKKTKYGYSKKIDLFRIFQWPWLLIAGDKKQTEIVRQPTNFRPKSTSLSNTLSKVTSLCKLFYEKTLMNYFRSPTTVLPFFLVAFSLRLWKALCIFANHSYSKWLSKHHFLSS